MEKRERTAFEILVRENASMLSAYLGSLLVDRNAIDDLFHEVMMVAWRSFDGRDSKQPFGPWLRGIASRLVMAEYRRKNKVPRLLSDDVRVAVSEQFDAIESNIGDTWEQHAEVLRNCVAGLPVERKEVILQRYRVGHSVEEIAASGELKIEACMKRLQQARVRLLRCLQSRGFLISEALPHE